MIVGKIRKALGSEVFSQYSDWWTRVIKIVENHPDANLDNLLAELKQNPVSKLNLL